MKIGIMLRHLGQPGGIGVYTHNNVASMLRLDQDNHYFLLYLHPEQAGQFPNHDNVTEVVLPARSKVTWDQIRVPLFAMRNGIDVLYNPKLAVPLVTRSRTVLVMHGAEQFAVPQAFQWHDRIYFTIANRLYCKFADSIITYTEQGANDISRYMHADRAKISVINGSFNERCRTLDQAELLLVREKYQLPEHYILFVGGLNPIKNFRNLLLAFHRVRQNFPHKLVVVGFKRWGVSEDFRLMQELELQNEIILPGYIPDEDIPAMYGLAGAFVFPSLYEGFGMPVLEAMACACPVITTERGCSPEVAGGAALLVNPEDPDQIAASIQRVLTDESLRAELIAKGLDRARQFSWERCAQETLTLLESVGKVARIGDPALSSSNPSR